MICIIHDQAGDGQPEATVIVGGMSVCSRHGRAIFDAIARGYTLESIFENPKMLD